MANFCVVFSTIIDNWPFSKWGSEFPHFIYVLYDKKLNVETIDNAKTEVEIIPFF